MSSPRIVCVGSIMCDLMSYVPRLPKPGESLMGCNIVPGNGGKGANSAVAAARLGANTAVIGMIGADYTSHGVFDNLEQNHVNKDFVFQTTQASTGVAIIIVEKSGENRIIVAANANLLLTADDVAKAEDLIKNSDIVVANFEINMEATKKALQLARKHGVKTILNAAPAVTNLDPEFYSLADVFIVNEGEAEITTGTHVNEDNYDQLAAELVNRGCECVVLTLGEKGVLLDSKNHSESTLIKATKVDAVDSTGAGDAFVGALAYFIVYHPDLQLKEQIRRASIYASISVQKAGTQTSYPHRHELPSELFS